MNRLFLLLAVLALCAPLFAHKGTLRGNVRVEPAKDMSGTTVTAAADPLWGLKTAEELAAYEKVNGKFPEATVTGATTTDTTGTFAIEIEFTFKDDAEPPKRAESRNGERVMIGYCAVSLTLAREGHRTVTTRTAVTVDGDQYFISTSLQESVTLRGSVVQLSDRSAVANQALRLSVLEWVKGPNGQNEPKQTDYEFSTDADGKFEFREEALNQGQATLVPLGGSLAFAASSKAGSSLYMRNGINDLGMLAVVPGGSLKFRLVHADSGKPIDVPGNLTTQRGASRTLTTTAGECTVLGLTEGDFELRLSDNTHWPSQTSVKIAAGVELDLGDITLEPYRTLEVIALSDGPGIEQYNVVATLVEGTPPYKARDNQPITVQANLSFERNQMTRMFSGKWRLNVSANGHANTEVEVTVPSDQPITVTLEQGGAIKVKLKISDRYDDGFRSIAVRVDSPSYEKFRDLTVKDWSEWHELWREPADTQARHPAQTWNEQVIHALRPGKYLVLCFAGDLGLMKREVEVEKAKTTDVEFQPEPPVVIVSVMREGKPAPGEAIYICQTSDRNVIGDFSEHVADTNGKVEVTLKNKGQIYVLNKYEREWLGEPKKDDWQWREQLRALMGDGTAVRFATRTEVSIELQEPGVVWLTLDATLPPGAKTQVPYLQPVNFDRNAGRRTIQGRLVGDKFKYMRVPVGEYEVQLSVPTVGREYTVLKQPITVDTPPEQEIKVVFEIRALTIRVNNAAGAPAAGVEVSLTPVASIDDANSMYAALRGRTDADGVVAFIGLDEGSYNVNALSLAANRQLSGVASATVDASAEGELQLTLNNEIATLELDVQGNPAIGGDRNGALCRVRLFNDMDEEVLPGMPSSAFGQVNHKVMVQGIPAGTYRVRVSAYGLQPVEQLGVVIAKGETTLLTLTPSAAGLLKLSFKGITKQDLLAGKATSTYYDASGAEVDVEAPGKAVFSLVGDDYSQFEARLLNLTPAVKKVVIRINGYEDIEIAVDVEPGKTLIHTATVRLKAD